ncbi:MAG: phosphoadenosine phosphosulfate reductase family protein [Firmicutes bacterium]|nr:phosphoadenosine phosphosulfate reductase family protein [Bacillota bacterium]
MSKKEYHVVSLSGGKDSTAMLLAMLEKNMPIDLILFCDTGLEFPEMYAHLDKLEKFIGRKITRVRAERSFEYYFLHAPIKRRNEAQFCVQFGKHYTGYGWAGPKMRWCTSVLKDIPRERFLRSLRKEHKIIEYIGIAADETYRLLRKRNQKPNHVHPLVDWNMTEADCLKYCYDRGFDWNELYERFSRASCWCCPLQSLSELRKLMHYYPKLWEQLKVWEKQTWRKFRADYSVTELESRFEFEKERLAQGKPIKGKEFFTELRKRLEVMSSE